MDLKLDIELCAKHKALPMWMPLFVLLPEISLAATKLTLGEKNLSSKVRNGGKMFDVHRNSAMCCSEKAQAISREE